MQHRILHVLSSGGHDATGAVRHVTALVSGLDRSRFEHHVWFLMGEGPLVSEVRNVGAQVRVLNWGGARRDPVGTWKLWRLLRDGEFSIVHRRFGGPSMRWLVRTATRAAFVVHLNGRVSESGGPCPVPRLVRGADVVIAVSRAVAECAPNVRSYIVYPAVFVPDSWGKKTASEEQIIGTAARLVPVKGMQHLIRAVALLRTEFPRLCLEIAGSGPERAALEKEVARHGLSRCVTFLGWQTDLVPALTRWDIFVLPSLEDAAPGAILQAMASGLPVVATAVGGIPELVEDGRTGWLVPPSDATALAGAVRRLLRNPEQNKAMGAAGRARVQEKFSMDSMVARISEIYDDILSR